MGVGGGRWEEADGERDTPRQRKRQTETKWGGGEGGCSVRETGIH